MPSPATLTVDLDALAANYRLIREETGTAVAPVVKADAYGLGVAPIARRLLAEGARSFFVARLEGGQRVRAVLGPDPEILVLDGCTAGGGQALKAAGLTPVLNSPAQLEMWRQAGGGACALHLDTGMNRLGFRPEEIDALLAAPDRLSGLDVTLVMSHLACADDPANPMNEGQRHAFFRTAQRFPEARKSLANSGGCFLGREFAYDLVRPGMALYGGGPEGRPDRRIRPVATLEAEVVQVRTVHPGETVGYSATWTAERTTRAAVLSIGYADGFSRAHSSPRGKVWLAGAPRPVLGRVSMDLTVVEIGEAEVAPGDRAELFGPNRPLDEAASDAGTLAYELLTGINPRVTRVHRGER